MKSNVFTLNDIFLLNVGALATSMCFLLVSFVQKKYLMKLSSTKYYENTLVVPIQFGISEMDHVPFSVHFVTTVLIGPSNV